MSTQKKFPEFVDDQRRYFDELITTDWSTYLDPDWDRTRQFEVDQLLARVRARRILDVGCGCGYHDVLMAETPGVESVIGIDYSEQSVAVAERQYPHAKVRREVSDLFTREPSRFDLVTTFCVLAHVRDGRRFLEACRHQVHDGGAVAVFTPNAVRLENRFRSLLGRERALIDPQHYVEHTADDLESLGRQAGLEMTDIFGYGMHFAVPRTDVGLIPKGLSERLGHRFKSLATRFGVIYRPA